MVQSSLPCLLGMGRSMAKLRRIIDSLADERARHELRRAVDVAAEARIRMAKFHPDRRDHGDAEKFIEASESYQQAKAAMAHDPNAEMLLVHVRNSDVPEVEPEPEPLRLIAHVHPAYREAWLVKTCRDGHTIAIGRDPLNAALARLREEGMIAAGDRFVISFADNNREPLEHVEQEVRKALRNE